LDRIGQYWGLGEAEELMEEYIEYHKICERYLEMFLKRKDYKKAKLVAKNGVTLGNNQKYTGISHKLEQWLEIIAQKENYKETVHRIRMRHFLDHFDMKLYEKLHIFYEKCRYGDRLVDMMKKLNY